MRSYVRFTRIPGDQFNIVFIRKVYVPPHLRGTGRARRMLTRFLERHRAAYIMLEAYPFGTGGPGATHLTRFYLSLGFRILRGASINLMIKEP